jgi:hypothetical protein
MEIIVPIVVSFLFVYFIVKKVREHAEDDSVELVPLDPMEIIHDEPKKIDLKMCGGQYFNIEKCE